MRGKALENGGGSLDVRITPACAGKSHFATNFHLNKRDHPRMCGEKPDSRNTLQLSPGSPPHVRGKAANTGYQTNEVWDHPRVCGEKCCCNHPVIFVNGITPAYAGKRSQPEAERDA